MEVGSEVGSKDSLRLGWNLGRKLGRNWVGCWVGSAVGLEIGLEMGWRVGEEWVVEKDLPGLEVWVMSKLVLSNDLVGFQKVDCFEIVFRFILLL